MNTFIQALRREARVAFSLKAQSLWFRIVKWIVGIAFMIAFHDRVWFWPAVAGWTVVALALHFLYRSKTRVWTQAWGGWNDLEAGRS
jgi:RsiW-degrading membrane proteinase PrsW (M82 family)